MSADSFLEHESDGYQFLLDLYHPEGMHCPECGRSVEEAAVHKRNREPVLKYRCGCGRIYDAFTTNHWKGTHYSCSTIVKLMYGLVREQTSTRELAEQLDVSLSSLIRHKKALERNGDLERAKSLFQKWTRESASEAEAGAGSGIPITLYDRDGALIGQSFLTGESEDIVVGSGPDAHVQIDDANVDPAHCVLRAREESYLLKDISTKGGITYRGEPVDEVGLQPGEEFSVGSYRIRVGRKGTAKEAEATGQRENGDSPERVRKKRRVHRRRRKKKVGTVVTGLFVLGLIAFSVFYFFRDAGQRTDSVASSSVVILEQATRDVKIHRDGHRIAGKPGMPLQARDRIRIPDGGHGEIRFRNETSRIRLEGELTADLRREDGTRRMHLENGTIHAEIERRTGRQLIVTTPMARAEIVGTTFTLSASETSRLVVSQGTVRYTSLQRKKTVNVTAGEYAEVRADGTLEHGSLREQPEENQSPVARAGDDVSVVDRDRDGSEQIELDGSGSEDPDGQIVEYRWSEKGWDRILAGEARSEIHQDVGSRQVQLEVIDDDGATDTDTVSVEVLAPPRAHAGDDRTVTDVDEDGKERVTLDASSSTDPDGRIASYSWEIEGEQVASGVQPEISLSEGTHQLVLNVTDDDGYSTSDTLTVSVVRNTVTAPFQVPDNGQRGFMAERSYGDHAAALAFDSRNRPYMFSIGEGMKGHVLTLRNGSWEKRSYTEALEREGISYSSKIREKEENEERGWMTFDDRDNMYILTENLTDDYKPYVLLFSPDFGDTFQAFEIPGAAMVETDSGHHDLANPPLIFSQKVMKENEEIVWHEASSYVAYTNLYVYVPKVRDGTLTLGDPIKLNEGSFTAASRVSYAAGHNLAVTTGRKAYVLYQNIEDKSVTHGEKTNAQYVAVVDRERKTVERRNLLGYAHPDHSSRKATSALTRDGDGFLHAVLGAEDGPFQYLRSEHPNRVDREWTEPVSIGTRQRFPALAHARNRLHILSQNGDALSYWWKLDSGDAWRRKTLVRAPEDYPGDGRPPFYYHRIMVDRRGSIYASFTFHRHPVDGPWAYPRMLVVSTDGGETWRPATTEGFQRRIVDRDAPSSSGNEK